MRKLLIVVFLLILITAESKSQNYLVDSVVWSLNVPTTFEFIPNSNNVIVTHRNGPAKIYDISNGSLISVFWDFTDSVYYVLETGLLGVCVDPDYSVNKYIYFYYTHNPNTFRVVRLTNLNNAGTSPFIVFSAAVLSMGPRHVGGNIHFGRDNKLYITIGDNGVPGYSQSLTTFLGKILRINSDGSIPAENPFYDDGNPATGNDDRIWVLGLRNSFEFCISPVNDSIYASENGANAYDEVNFIKKGKNYGWPHCEGYCFPYNPAYKQPMHVWGQFNLPAVTGIMVYQGAQMPWLNGKLLVGDNNDGRIHLCNLNNTLDSVVSRVQILDLEYLTALKQGPDDFIYAMKGGIPTVPGKIYRIRPDLTGGINPNVETKFSLSQNYPNPFNPSTSIRYEIPKTSFISLKIYDVLGIEIASLVNETKQLGSHEAVWDASAFPSGVYFYELSAGEFKERKKMVMIK